MSTHYVASDAVGRTCHQDTVFCATQNEVSEATLVRLCIRKHIKQQTRTQVVLFFVLILLVAGGCGDKKKGFGTLPHFRDSINAIQEAFKLQPQLVAKYGKGRAAFSVPDSDPLQQKMVKLYRAALRAANKVEPNDLSRMHPDMPRHFRDEYRAGLRMIVDGFEGNDGSAESGARGTILVNKWGDWERVSTGTI